MREKIELRSAGQTQLQELDIVDVDGIWRPSRMKHSDRSVMPAALVHCFPVYHDHVSTPLACSMIRLRSAPA